MKSRDRRTIQGTRSLFPRFVPRICNENRSDGVPKEKEKNCMPEGYARSAWIHRALRSLFSLLLLPTLSIFLENERDSGIQRHIKRKRCQWRGLKTGGEGRKREREKNRRERRTEKGGWKRQWAALRINEAPRLRAATTMHLPDIRYIRTVREIFNGANIRTDYTILLFFSAILFRAFRSATTSHAWEILT